MTDDDFRYSRSLAPLESLLAGVKRPGDFCVHGAMRECIQDRLIDAVRWRHPLVVWFCHHNEIELAGSAAGLLWSSTNFFALHAGRLA